MGKTSGLFDCLKECGLFATLERGCPQDVESGFCGVDDIAKGACLHTRLHANSTQLLELGFNAAGLIWSRTAAFGKCLQVRVPGNAE